MAKPKVLYVITKGNWGGAQKYVYDLALGAAADHEVCVAFGDGNQLDQKLKLAGIRTIQIPGLQRDINPLLDLKSFFALWKIFRQERPDIVHVNSPKISGLGTLAARLQFVPHIIFTAHGWTFNEDRSALSKIIIRFFSWLTMLFSHKTIVLGQKEYHQALAFPFISQKKVVCIPLGIKPPDFKDRTTARTLLAQQANVPADTSLWLGTISELHNNKGLSYIIEALSKLDQPFHFFIIGSGEEFNRLQTLVTSKHLQGNIHFLGHVQDAASLLKAFDIFTLTSIKEGLPYVILEAGLAEVPVIASHVGNISDVIVNNQTGILTGPKNISDITQALKTLINNPDFRSTLAQNLQQKITTAFSHERMVTETFKLYS